MGKIVSGNHHHKRANKHTKNKTRANKQQPLKVVYITNPIKFKASASEFRALVQELTGQDADTPESFEFPVADGGGEAERAHALLDKEVTKIGNESSINGHHQVWQRHDSSNGHDDHQVLVQRGLDPSVTGGAYNERLFCASQMMEDLNGLVDSNLWA